jgi:hypothetical protein
MNQYVRGMTVRGIVDAPVFAAVLAFPLLLVGCYSPHKVYAVDTVYCEKQGFRPGTDANVKCAEEHEAERGASDVGGEPVATQPILSAVAPPSWSGGVTQETPHTVPPGTTRVINFAISVNSDCVAVGVPQVRVGEQPAHGILKLIHTTDFARLSEIGAPPTCADRKVEGAALLYTAKKDYEGDDLVQVEVTTPAGHTYFKVPITIETPEEE